MRIEDEEWYINQKNIVRKIVEFMYQISKNNNYKKFKSKDIINLVAKHQTELKLIEYFNLNEISGRSLLGKALVKFSNRYFSDIYFKCDKQNKKSNQWDYYFEKIPKQKQIIGENKMDMDKLIMNKLLESFEKQTKPQLINQCNALFDVIWSNDELKEKLVNNISINVGSISDVVTKSEKFSEKVVVDVDDRDDLTPEQKEARKKIKEKRLTLLEKKKELEEKENIVVNGLDIETSVDDSIKDVLEQELNEPLEKVEEVEEVSKKVEVVEALPPLDEPKVEVQKKTDEDFLMN